MTQIPSVAIPALQRLAAAELFVEQSMVKTHLIHLYSKLGVHSRTQAVARAAAAGLTSAAGSTPLLHLPVDAPPPATPPS